jgi:hypothetical protein
MSCRSLFSSTTSNGLHEKFGKLLRLARRTLRYRLYLITLCTKLCAFVRLVVDVSTSLLVSPMLLSVLAKFPRPFWEASCSCVILHKFLCFGCHICNLEVVFNCIQVRAMDEFDLYLKRCRLCASEHRLGLNLFGTEGVTLDLKSKIKMYLSINVSWLMIVFCQHVYNYNIWIVLK